MDIVVDALVMGAQSGLKKDKSEFYKVDLYIAGVGAFDKSCTAGEFVMLSKLPAGTLVRLSLKLNIGSSDIKLDSGRSFSVRRLGVQVGDLALPENVRKAS